MNDPILAVRQLEIAFPDADTKEKLLAVKGIDFVLQRGEILGIVGESGSGKSVTSLGIIGLVPKPGWVESSSEIDFFAQAQGSPVNLVALPEGEKRQYRGGKIAMIFQEPMSSLNPVYTIGFQIIEAIRLHQNVTQEQAQQQAIALLQEVRVLPRDEVLEEEFLAQEQAQPSVQISRLGSALVPTPRVSQSLASYIQKRKRDFLKRYPHELSGGQLQRVMIAMAISANPRLLIADEPTTALDVTVQAEILRLLRDLCKQHQEMSLIFISHDLGVINEIADRVAVMYRGEIVEQGLKEQILHNPQHPYTKGLLACRPRLEMQLDHLPTVGDFLNVDGPAPSYQVITPAQEGDRLAQLQTKPPLLEVQNLTVSYGQGGFWGKRSAFTAVNDVSFTVYPGETLGLVGESGCGKSTLARALLRLTPIEKGKIIFDGRNIVSLPAKSQQWRRLRREMQIIFQNPYNSLNPRMTIGRAIQEPLIIHQPKQPAKQQRERVAELLERVGISPQWFNRYPHELSGGQRQRICIARALALNPRFIICDESVSALDVSVQAQVLNLLKELQRDLQLTYIFISHDLSVVRFMGDRIMVMNRGQLAEPINTAQEIIENPQSAYTQKLIQSIPRFPETLNWLQSA
ncbi:MULTISPECIES: ABC transporter ATP-binding protein [unclassified Synechocystis]|uniref:ABC transporter ATP-binding protein n=1 Tax=unclassified Synechocystis TaxID=2640012 RepID=UPI00041CA1CB|nr:MULTISPECIES: ABC transporter ATP-binding protein [unclassified Synechocystis]AIE72874.1 Oligopeptide transport ATP-binding protein OppF [Synechocystis sp. PCC 6714]MCT0252642.1 ABC transporter ATP-binding protein [Synechocystis sp. CS-94]